MAGGIHRTPAEHLKITNKFHQFNFLFYFFYLIKE
jgi:hypothetical protein